MTGAFGMPSDECLLTPINPTPQIFLVDMGGGVADLLESKLFNCLSGSIGSLINSPKRQGSEELLQPDHSIPVDLHEYDVVVLDVGARNSSQLSQNCLIDSRDSNGAKFSFLSRYPEQTFNSKPFGLSRLSPMLNELLRKGKIVIVFSDAAFFTEYEVVKIGSARNYVEYKTSYSNMHVYNGIPNYKNKTGRKLVVSSEISYGALLSKYLPGAEYRIEFNHPQIWQDDEKILDERFVPLMFNDDGGVVSYCHSVSGGFVFMFPQLVDKKNFLLDFFSSYLPEFCPELFPFSDQFGWLDDGSYPLPGETKLLIERREIEAAYNAALINNKNSILSLKQEFHFLRELVSATGDELVKAIKCFFEWLGFESVINMDDHCSVVLEEDIQVECNKGLLVVEVKGIGGTSTDKQCSQISKIKHRRCEERNKFDVYGLYIVNHQRYLSPKVRVNPPFSKEQLTDAVLDRRGLLTTYDLYKAYFLVVEGILEKWYIREKLFDVGLIDLSPSGFKSLGVVEEVFKGGEVGIVTLNDFTLDVGMKVVSKKGGAFTKHTIIEIREDDNIVESANSGEVGLRFDSNIKSKAELFVLPVKLTPE